MAFHETMWLTDKILFGGKPTVEEYAGTVWSVINVAHSIRKPYWDNVGKLDWDVWYFRMASPDREKLEPSYIYGLMDVVNLIWRAGKFPLLCHCRMGGHRGPSAAMFAAWVMSGCNRINEWIAEVDRIQPGFAKPNVRRVYRDNLIRFCRWFEENGGEDYKG